MKLSTIIIILLVLLVAAGALAFYELRADLSIEIDDHEQNVTVWAWTVGEALAEAGVPVWQEDKVIPAVDERLPKDGRIRVERAFWVLITADGESHAMWTSDNQPAVLLKLAGVDLQPGDVLLQNGLPIDPQEALPQAASYSLQIQRTTPLTIDGDTFRSTEPTLGAALWEQGIFIHNGDQLEPAFETPLRGQPITAELRRGRQITIQSKNGSLQARVLAETVGKALVQAGAALQGLDYSIPPETAPLPISDTIRVVRVHEEISLETEPLAFGFLTQPLDDVELDTQQVVQVGEYGLTAKRVRVVFEDGVEVARQTEDEWVAREPKPRIVGYGTKINIRTLEIPGGTIEYWRAVNVYASTYSPCHSGGDKCYPNTSSGKPVQKGMIAVTLPWYRYMQGLPAYVPNYGFGSIEDVGGGLPDRYWIDLGYSDEDWVGWGGWTTIYFLTPVPANIMWILE
ncbi:MAG: ubiquitin-like domain-containing protein [Anaerolineales bacterium]